MTKSLPGGAGIYYQPKDGKFSIINLLPRNGWSMKAILWLEYLQKTNFDGTIIRHALNGGEKSIVLDGVRFKADGFCVYNGVNHYFFFNGCRYHKCNCQNSLKSPYRDQNYERDQKLKKICSKHGKHIEIFECQFDKLKIRMEENKVSCFFDKMMRNQLVTQQDIFNKIENGKFYGIICCDVRSPPDVVQRWSQLGWPPIPTHVTPTVDMIQPAIAAEMEKRNVKLEKQLTLVFNEKEHVMTTDFFQFYLKKGLKMSNLKWALEYTRDTPVKKFINTMTQHRKDAERNGNKPLVELYKLIVNSSYGSFGLNVRKHLDHSFEHIKEGSRQGQTEGPLIAATHHMLGEYSTGITQIFTE